MLWKSIKTLQKHHANKDIHKIKVIKIGNNSYLIITPPFSKLKKKNLKKRQKWSPNYDEYKLSTLKSEQSQKWKKLLDVHQKDIMYNCYKSVHVSWSTWNQVAHSTSEKKKRGYLHEIRCMQKMLMLKRL